MVAFIENPAVIIGMIGSAAGQFFALATYPAYAPQTLPAVGAGVLMVFIQALGYYVTPALVGGPDDQMLSYFVSFYATKTINWGMAAALSLALLAATLVLYWLYDRWSASTGCAWDEARCAWDELGARA